MYRSVNTIRPIHVVPRRVMAGTVLLLLFLTALPAYAAALTGPGKESAPALSGPAEIESAPSLGTTPPQPDRITGEYVKGYFTDTGRMLASPANWDGSDWLTAGLVIGATAGTYLVDADIRNFARRNQSSTGDSLAVVGNTLGNPVYTLPPLGLLYLYGNLNEDPKARRTSLLAVESLAISGVFTWTLKLATQRPRPFTGESPGTWNGPGLRTINPAFPSGHTPASFAVATVVAEEYGNNPYIPPLAYGLATLTGLSRIYDDKHWASDVVFGAAIGYFVAKTVVGYHKSSGSASVKILPTFNQDGFGLTAQYRF